MKATVALHSAAAPFLFLIFDEDELAADEETLFIAWKKQHENYTFIKTDLISASLSHHRSLLQHPALHRDYLKLSVGLCVD